MEDEIVDTESREVGVMVRPTSNITLFGSSDPEIVIEKAQATAKALTKIIEEQHLYTPILGKKYVRVEGWTLLGSMLGVFPHTVWTRPIMEGTKNIGWESRVEACTLAGNIVGTAEAECMKSERRWDTAEDYAVRSMSQTRGVSKALSMALRFIVSLVGYEGTPAEEVPPEGFENQNSNNDENSYPCPNGDCKGRLVERKRKTDGKIFLSCNSWTSKDNPGCGIRPINGTLAEFKAARLSETTQERTDLDGVHNPIVASSTLAPATFMKEKVMVAETPTQLKNQIKNMWKGITKDRAKEIATDYGANTPREWATVLDNADIDTLNLIIDAIQYTDIPDTIDDDEIPF